MIRVLIGMLLVIALAPSGGCKREAPTPDARAPAGGDAEGDRTPAAGHDSAHEHAAPGVDVRRAAESGHHDEIDLESVDMGDMTVKFAQGHGLVEAGSEGHLVVKLPYNDNGATIVRAWLGTEDRTASFVGKGIYAAPHDDYDVHAIAPAPLPEHVMWWVEITKPDGTTVVGSVKPLVK